MTEVEDSSRKQGPGREGVFQAGQREWEECEDVPHPASIFLLGDSVAV